MTIVYDRYNWYDGLISTLGVIENYNAYIPVFSSPAYTDDLSSLIIVLQKDGTNIHIWISQRYIHIVNYNKFYSIDWGVFNKILRIIEDTNHEHISDLTNGNIQYLSEAGL